MTMLKINRYSTWGHSGRNWQSYCELYYVPVIDCGCGCGSLEKFFKLEDCVQCEVEPINTLLFYDSQDDNTFYDHEILLYNPREVIGLCPAGMVPAEVEVRDYEDGQYVKVETFLN